MELRVKTHTIHIKVFLEATKQPWFLKVIYYVFKRIENIVGTGKNACYQHFLLSPQCF